MPQPENNVGDMSVAATRAARASSAMPAARAMTGVRGTHAARLPAAVDRKCVRRQIVAPEALVEGDPQLLRLDRKLFRAPIEAHARASSAPPSFAAYT